jgi:hypothetical protein
VTGDNVVKKNKGQCKDCERGRQGDRRPSNGNGSNTGRNRGNSGSTQPDIVPLPNTGDDTLVPLDPLEPAAPLDPLDPVTDLL